MWPFSKRKPPPTDPTDKVIPFRFSDNHLRVSWDYIFLFEDVLDPEKLRNGLDILVQKDGWRNLGARIRPAKGKELEYHVPAEYTEKRPAYKFTRTKHNICISDHEYLSQLPRNKGEKITVFEPPSQSYRPYLRDPHTPEYLEDWLYSDSPQLAIHVVSFTDVTILTVTMPHTLSDAMGLGAFMDAWTKVLNGEEHEVPRLVGFGGGAEDPLSCLYNGSPKSPFVLTDKLVSGWSRVMYIVHSIFEILWYWETETRMTVVPGKFLSNLRESLRQQLRDDKDHGMTTITNDHNTGTALPFLSESDVLLTWWTQIVVRAQSPPPQRIVSLLNLADTRGVLSKMSPLLPPGSVVMANAMFPMTSLIPAREFISKTASTPLSQLSSYVREAIEVQRTEDQLLAHAALIKESFDKYGHSPVYGRSDVHRVVCTNWHRGGFFNLDFSGAIVEDERTGVKTGGNAKGKPTLITSTWVDQSFLLRNFIVIVGKDALGNWWLMTRIRPKHWKGIEKQIEHMGHM